MCGIWGFFGSTRITNVAEHVATLEPRGPEFTEIRDMSDCVLGFTRLAINGLSPAGNQPMTSPSGRYIVVCNGEIYNYKFLAVSHGIPAESLGSDCYIIPALLEKYDVRTVCRLLDGVFAFLAWDTMDKRFIAGRDFFGVRPLFWAPVGTDIAFASEIKALSKIVGVGDINEFTPTSWAEVSRRKPYYPLRTKPWGSLSFLQDNVILDADYCSSLKYLPQISKYLYSAVHKRLLSDRPIGALLSGGLDSSLIAAIAARLLKETNQKLHTFSIGLGMESPDILAARKVAAHIDSIHHEVIFSQEEFLAAIPAVIKAVETYDITTVRASVGNWLIGKWIRENTDIKVILNGDGSDEVFGGYLYFGRAPNAVEFENEIERLLTEIHRYDVRRSERSMAAHGLESRTPFLDRKFVDIVRQIPTELLLHRKDRCEKHILRAAFAETDLLPPEILWRRKEAFSDGVSSGSKSWFEIVKEHCSNMRSHSYYPNKVLSHILEIKGIPETDESMYYLDVFMNNFGYEAISTLDAPWMPRWSPETKDPSARTLSLYAGEQKPEPK